MEGDGVSKKRQGKGKHLLHQGGRNIKRAGLATGPYILLVIASHRRWRGDLICGTILR